ncbi:MAG TPA: SsrA-binding protein SmpB [Patescibacteria group bacterium]
MVLVLNKRATHDYSFSQTLYAGIVLTGPEVKSLRLKHGSLQGSFVKIIGEEAFLLNAQINPYAYADNREYDPKRTRKLLLKKKEVFKLMESSSQKGNALIPLAIEAQGRQIKLKLGIGAGKKQHEKRSELKKRAMERDVQREMKEKVRLR